MKCWFCCGKGWFEKDKVILPCPICDLKNKTGLKFVTETTYGVKPSSSVTPLLKFFIDSSEGWRLHDRHREARGKLWHRRN